MFGMLKNPAYVEPVGEFSERLAEFVDDWRYRLRADPVIMSGVLAEQALELRRAGRLTADPPGADARQLLKPDSYDFRPALLRFLADFLKRGIAPVTVAAMCEQWAERLG